MSSQQFEGSKTSRLLSEEIEEKLDEIRDALDVALSTRASEATLISILAQLDIVLSDVQAYLLTYRYPPSTAYFGDDTAPYPDWDALGITGGDITLGVVVTGYAHKTICFISDTQGTLTIEVLEPDGATWRDFDVLGITADILRSIQMEEQATQVRISFSEAATVSAWLTLGVA